MKPTYTFWILLAISLQLLSASYAQNITKVFIDNTNRTFNQGNALPSATYFQVTGAAPAEVTIVKLEIRKNAKSRDILFQNQWKRHFSDDGRTFYIPVDYKLQSNSSYALKLVYYKTLSGEELKYFQNKVYSNLDAYLKAVITNDRNQIRLDGNVRENVDRLNSIITDAYRYYESHLEGGFEGFSDLVRLKLKQIKDVELDNARYNVRADSTNTEAEIRRNYASKLQGELLSMLKSESESYIATGVRTRYDEISINEYPTETTKTFLPVNIGYGAVYLGGSANDLEYDAQPYAGISIPLANSRFRKVLGNASLSFGIFLKDFEDKAGNRLTGPLINKPFYLGLGYKIFNFIKLNAGAVAISTERVDFNNFRTEDVSIKPFIGISAELNIWMGNNKR